MSYNHVIITGRDFKDRLEQELADFSVRGQMVILRLLSCVIFVADYLGPLL